LSGVSLEGSELMFPDLVQLICAYCHTRSPEPSTTQPLTKSWRPSPIWALSSGAPPSTSRLSRARLEAQCCPS
ncbi:RIN1 isoform 7, partial [Pan troglodytes]